MLAKMKAHTSYRLKIFGGIQIHLGIVIAALGVASIVIDRLDLERLESESNSDLQYILLGLNGACVVTGAWVVFTGFAPCCVCGDRADVIKSVVKFMVFNILTASLFVPVSIGAAIAGFLLRGSDNAKLVVCPALLVGFSLLEFLVAIATSAYCCCNYPWKGKGVKHSKDWKRNLLEWGSSHKHHEDGDEKEQDWKKYMTQWGSSHEHKGDKEEREKDWKKYMTKWGSSHKHHKDNEERENDWKKYMTKWGSSRRHHGDKEEREQDWKKYMTKWGRSDKRHEDDEEKQKRKEQKKKAREMEKGERKERIKGDESLEKEAKRELKKQFKKDKKKNKKNAENDPPAYESHDVVVIVPDDVKCLKENELLKL